MHTRLCPVGTVPRVLLPRHGGQMTVEIVKGGQPVPANIAASAGDTLFIAAMGPLVVQLLSPRGWLVCYTAPPVTELALSEDVSRMVVSPVTDFDAPVYIWRSKDVRPDEC